jgi:hypothetical protein
MENSNVQDPKKLKINITADPSSLWLKRLQSEVERLDELARDWGLPVKFLMVDPEAHSEVNCHTCAFRFFLYTHHAGCFATKLAGASIKLPTAFRLGQIPDEKPKWCPLDKIFITVIDD